MGIKRFILIIILSLLSSLVLFLLWSNIEYVYTPKSYTSHEAVFEDYQEIDTRLGFNEKYSLKDLQNWQRPTGPYRVGLQVGHLHQTDLPEELSGLARNGAGATFGKLNERDTMKVIVEKAVALLEQEGIIVDLLPAVVPPGYVADAFVSVHADGNPRSSVSGFKVAAPRRDYSGQAILLEEIFYQEYQKATGLKIDKSITRRMTGYYAFNWGRYEHAIHPMTPAVILETGFLTSPVDRKIIVDNPDLAALGIANSVLAFLNF